jgi:hypothetical protein
VKFSPEAEDAAAQVCAFLRAGGLRLHPLVERVVLHGSRVPGGCPRPESDIDLSLLVRFGGQESQAERLSLLAEVTDAALASWSGPLELDIAVVFDQRGCSLACFGLAQWQPGDCRLGGVDCFGLYKTQKGFDGLVENAGILVARMLPSLVLWQKETEAG